jgi:hypothetical protein
MTHTLHRRGTPENLEQDYVVFSMTAKGFNERGSRGALEEFLRILAKYDVANVGDMKTGNKFIVDKEIIFQNIQDTSIVHAVFTDRNQVTQALRELKEADLGVSVIVSGIVEHVHESCQEAGLDRHTVEYSVGIRGNLALLPEDEILEVTTMCGHGMVSQYLVRQMIIDIKKGRRDEREAAELLATPCVCGVFNPVRAQRLLRELAEIWCLDEV